MSRDVSSAACRVEMARRDLTRILAALRPLDAALARIPDERLAEQPVPGQYAAGLMIAHAYHVVATCALAVRQGRLTEADAAGLGTPEGSFMERDAVASLGARAREEAAALRDELDEARVDASIDFHFGLSATGLETLGLAYGELLHHRGQVQTFLRLMGIEPPDVYAAEPA